MVKKSIQFQSQASKILAIAQRLYARNMLSAADGNISYRISDNEILITPSGVAKAFMCIEDMAIITLNDEIIFGQPSGERLMHLEVYRKCPEARAVVHAHPPTAIGFSVAHPEAKELPCEALSEVILACGRIPLIPFALPGTVEMGTLLHPYLPQLRAFILSRHGALTWGEDLEEAWRGMERIENSAQILLCAQQWGGITKLPPDDIEKLNELRRKIGSRLL